MDIDKTWINKDNLFWQRVDEFMLQGFFLIKVLN